MTPDSTIRRVYRLLERGYGVKEIAHELGVEERTVRRYITDGRTKFGNAPNTRVALARFVLADRPPRRRRHEVADGQMEMIG